MTAISIHAPLTGCDKVSSDKKTMIFISIHAPLTGCDQIIKDSTPERMNFNPRTPDGVRLGKGLSGCVHEYFNPRTPDGVRQMVKKRLV